MPVKISSAANTRVKSIVRMRRRTKHSGKVLVDGRLEVEKAVTSGVTVHELYFCTEFADKAVYGMLEKADAPQFEVEADIFVKLTGGEPRDGILMVCEPKTSSLSDLEVHGSALYLVLENVEKPNNLGAIMRTCDSAGVDAVLVCDQQTYLYNPNAVRSSMGAIFTVKLVSDTAENIEAFLTANGVNILIAAPNTETSYTNIDFRKKSAILVGAENSGVTQFWMSKPHQKINIPMLGTVDSLNVSSSSAIILYEAVRQRQ